MEREDWGWPEGIDDVLCTCGNEALGDSGHALDCGVTVFVERWIARRRAELEGPE